MLTHTAFAGSALLVATVCAAGTFKGRFFDGEGDAAYLGLLDTAYEMLQPTAKMANLPMLYMSKWNGFVEGPTWDAWWIQNSFGPSYTMMPFLGEPYQTWLANSQKMWFDMMADGKRADQNGYVAPDGCLCDAATQSIVYYRQGDGNVAIHDWCIGFTTAGLLLQSELLLIKRDKAEIERYLPKLERVAAFLDSRRDPNMNLIVGGVASNLLAPSYGGWLRTDGSRDKAYLAELSVNYVAALNRLIEVCKLAGHADKARVYAGRRDLVKKALPKLMTDDGCFMQALNPEGPIYEIVGLTDAQMKEASNPADHRVGVYGAPKHGFFEAAPNHDAMCFRVVDDAQAKRIYEKIRSIPELRPFKLILPNYPSYDNMYESTGLFQYGVWVNGGHWTTAEARMMMGYYRVGAYSDAAASVQRILELAQAFRADNNLTDRGAKLYQPGQPYNVVYDCWGAPGAFLRGLFEYEYSADGLQLYPHVPPGITHIVQKFPIYFGARRVFISASGSGPLTGVRVNGKTVKGFESKSVMLRLDPSDGDTTVELLLGGARPRRSAIPKPAALVAPKDAAFWQVSGTGLAPVGKFYELLTKEELAKTYAGEHAAVIVEAVRAAHERSVLRAQGKLPKLELPGIPQADQAKVEALYADTAIKLTTGLKEYLKGISSSSDPKLKRVAAAAKAAGLL